MAPKRRPEEEGRGKLKKLKVFELPPAPGGINANIWVKHRDNVQIVMHDPKFSPLAKKDPLGITASGSSGHIAPFDKDIALQSLRSTQKHMCAVNLFWLDPFYCSIEKFPLNWTTIDTLSKSLFGDSGDGFSEVPLEVPVLAAQVEAADFGTKGTWRHSCPTEMIMAFFAATAEAVSTGADLDRFKLFALTAPCKFVAVATEPDIEWRSRQVRENLREGSKMATTPVQRIFDINTKRFENGVRLTRDQIVDLYNDPSKLRLSSLSEPITKSLVDSAFTIWDRALAVPSIQEVVLAEEAFKENSLFNATQKLQQIISKSQTAENIQWSFQLLHYYHKAGFITTEDCSVRRLAGGRKDQQGAGLIDIITFKKRILSYYIDVVLPKQQMPSEHREAFRETCQSISQYRKRSQTKAHGF